MSTETITIPIDLNREYTAEEYELLEDDGNRYELIEGKLVIRPPHTVRQSHLFGYLLFEMNRFLKTNSRMGEVWSQVGCIISKKPSGRDTVLEPDLAFVSSSRIPTEEDGYLPYPDLAVEVWSRSSGLADANKLKKARQKLQMYLKAGTQIAWRINPVTQEVEVYYQDGAKKVLGLGDELDGEDVIPGFKMEIEALFKHK